MSHSSVSRMRSGQRVASIDVLELITENYEVDAEALLHAAAAATRGDLQDWCQLLDGAFRDDQPDEEDSELVTH